MMEKEGLIGLQIAQGFVWYKSVVKAYVRSGSLLANTVMVVNIYRYHLSEY